MTPYSTSAFNVGILSNTYENGRGCIEFNGKLTSIGDKAFYNCTGLNGTLTIPSSVTSIGQYAFYLCSGFTGSLTIPSSMTSIGDYAFHKCSGFNGTLTIPSSVTSIGQYAFYYCSGFTGSLTIPGSVTSIGMRAFYYCSGFTGNLTIPNSVTSIGQYAFAYCSGFTGSLTIPSGLTSISNGAFYYCPGFNGTLTIPSSVTSIGQYAFENCKSLQSVSFESYPSVGSYAFDKISCYKTLSLTDDSYVYTDAANSGFPSLASAPTYTRTGIKNQWGTIVVPFAVTPDSSKPYSFYEITAASDEELTLTKITSTIAAGTPVIIGIDADEVDGKTYDLTLTADNTTVNAATLQDGSSANGLTLKGTYATTDLTANTGYFISNDAFWCIDDHKVKMPPFRAWLAGSLSSGAKQLSIHLDDNGTATALDMLNRATDGTDDAVIYDIQGHRLSTLRPGVNIIRMSNGQTKKIYIK